MKVSGWNFLDHMIEDCEDILEIVRETVDYDVFVTQRNKHKAVLYSLLNIGELMKTFSEQEQLMQPDIPWKRIIGFRDRAAHGYHALNLNIVWEIATLHIAPLLELLKLQKSTYGK